MTNGDHRSSSPLPSKLDLNWLLCELVSEFDAPNIILILTYRDSFLSIFPATKLGPHRPFGRVSLTITITHGNFVDKASHLPVQQWFNMTYVGLLQSPYGFASFSYTYDIKVVSQF